MNKAPQETSLASKLMFVFMSFETGHPVFAFIAMDWNVASSIPGIFATMERYTEVMAKPSRSLSMTTSDLLSNCSGTRFAIPSIRTNDMAKHAAFWLAAGDVSPVEIGSRLKGIPMSALKHDGSTHGFPRDAFNAMVDKAGS